jgi:hypothetical protein
MCVCIYIHMWYIDYRADMLLIYICTNIGYITDISIHASPLTPQGWTRRKSPGGPPRGSHLKNGGNSRRKNTGIPGENATWIEDPQVRSPVINGFFLYCLMPCITWDVGMAWLNVSCGKISQSHAMLVRLLCESRNPKNMSDETSDGTMVI